MNKDIAAGQWKQLKGKVREHWGRMTDDEVDQIQGRYENLIGKIQEKYGVARDEADKQASEFLGSFESGSSTRRSSASSRLS
jgi:uncharacterized protein YjbJ (UPF0337 family)